MLTVTQLVPIASNCSRAATLSTLVFYKLLLLAVFRRGSCLCVSWLKIHRQPLWTLSLFWNLRVGVWLNWCIAFKRRVNSSCLCQVYWLWSVLDLTAPHNEMTASLMQSFRKQYLKLVLLSSLKYVTNEIFLYKMTNGHLNIFINQFHFDSLLDQGHFVNALDSTLAHFIARATPLLTAYSSHPFCKAKAPLKWNIGLLKLVIEPNGNCSVTDCVQACFCPQNFRFHTLWTAVLFSTGTLCDDSAVFSAQSVLIGHSCSAIDLKGSCGDVWQKKVLVIVHLLITFCSYPRGGKLFFRLVL